MFRNQYDTEVALWSPQGRLFQVEYAMEAVSLGTTSVGLKNAEYAVLVALSKPTAVLGMSIPKIFPIDKFIGMAISGITSDARYIGQYLRAQCNSYRHSYDSSYPVGRLANHLGIKLQVYTQGSRIRPIGVGMLLAGCDELGLHIYQVMPSANVFNCKAMAMGGRSQGSRTYLERHLESFQYCEKDALICHGINAIKAAHPVNDGLQITIGLVGKNHPFQIFSPAECYTYQELCKVINDFPDSDDATSPAASAADPAADLAADRAAAPGSTLNESQLDFQSNNQIQNN